MKKRRFIWCALLWIILLSHVSAETIVEYKYTGMDNDQKRIQLVWTLVPDKDVKMTEYNHEITLRDTLIEIPKYTPFEQKLINAFGYEKLNKLVWNVINIEWYKYRFRKFHDVPWVWETKEQKLENKDILYANMNHYRTIIIESDTDQEVTFKLYPIPSEYHAVEYGRDSLNNEGYKYGLPDSNTLITLYDTTSEYHNIRWWIRNNPITMSELYEEIEKEDDFTVEYNLGSKGLEIEKKYELFTFKRKFAIWLDWESKVLLPYYEFTVDVKKWKNDLSLSYYTYQFEWEKIQIR